MVTLGNLSKAELGKTVEVLKRYRIPANGFAGYVEEFVESIGMNLMKKKSILIFVILPMIGFNSLQGIIYREMQASIS